MGLRNELNKRTLKIERQVPITIKYDGIMLDEEFGRPCASIPKRLFFISRRDAEARRKTNGNKVDYKISAPPRLSARFNFGCGYAVLGYPGLNTGFVCMVFSNREYVYQPGVI